MRGHIYTCTVRKMSDMSAAPIEDFVLFLLKGLVFAGIADLARPADKLSPSQSTALAATGLIWARYSLVIIPKNWLLFSVNIGLGITGINQLCRIAYYRYTLEKSKESNENQAKIEQTAN